MKIEKEIKLFQAGGELVNPATEDPNAVQDPNAAPASGGEDPIIVLAQMAAQALQNNDGQMALQVCEGFLQLVQSMSGGGGAVPQGEPVYKKGGVLSRRISR